MYRLLSELRTVESGAAMPPMYPLPISVALSRPDLLAGEAMPPSPRQERSRRKQQALLEAALALFAERGYDATTIEEIAHRAGVAVGGFYQHFKSKRQVLLVLMNCLVREVTQIDLGLHQEPDPREALARMVRYALQLDWTYVGAYRAWREAIVHDAELAARSQELQLWTADLLAEVLRAVSAFPGARPDVDVRATAWVLNTMFWTLASHPVPDLEAVVQSVSRMLYHTMFRDE